MAITNSIYDHFSKFVFQDSEFSLKNKHALLSAIASATLSSSVGFSTFGVFSLSFISVNFIKAYAGHALISNLSNLLIAVETLFAKIIHRLVLSESSSDHFMFLLNLVMNSTIFKTIKIGLYILTAIQLSFFLPTYFFVSYIFSQGFYNSCYLSSGLLSTVLFMKLIRSPSGKTLSATKKSNDQEQLDFLFKQIVTDLIEGVSKNKRAEFITDIKACDTNAYISIATGCILKLLEDTFIPPFIQNKTVLEDLRREYQPLSQSEKKLLSSLLILSCNGHENLSPNNKATKAIWNKIRNFAYADLIQGNTAFSRFYNTQIKRVLDFST